MRILHPLSVQIVALNSMVRLILILPQLNVRNGVRGERVGSLRVGHRQVCIAFLKLLELLDLLISGLWEHIDNRFYLLSHFIRRLVVEGLHLWRHLGHAWRYHWGLISSWLEKQRWTLSCIWCPFVLQANWSTATCSTLKIVHRECFLAWNASMTSIRRRFRPLFVHIEVRSGGKTPTLNLLTKDLACGTIPITAH